jgi:hypothetical protein
MIRFSKLDFDLKGELVETAIREISKASIQKCPYYILVADHYRQNGTCRCNDPNHKEMEEWGYHWKDGEWKSGDDL